MPLVGADIVMLNASMTPAEVLLPIADTQLPLASADEVDVALVRYVVADVVVTVRLVVGELDPKPMVLSLI